MFFKFQRRYNLLKVDDMYARLVYVQPTNDLDFEFTYSISQMDAIQKEALTVNVSVFSRTVTKKPLFEDSYRGSINTKKLVKNILSQVPDAKNALKKQEEFVIAHKNSAVLSSVNNEILGQVSARAAASNIPQLSQSTLKSVPASQVKENNEIKPVLDYVVHSTIDHDTLMSSSVDANQTELMYDMIVKQGIDPSFIGTYTPRNTSSPEAIGGLCKAPSAPEYFSQGSSSRLLDTHVFSVEQTAPPRTTDQVSDATHVQVFVSSVETDVTLPVLITIPRTYSTVNGEDNAHLFVKFELLNSRTGIALDTVIKPLDVAKHIQLYNTPKIAPVLNIARSDISSRANLEVKQIDPGAVGVQVFTKKIHRATIDTDDYVLVGSYDVKSTDQTLLVQVDSSTDSTIIYRVVPFGLQGAQSFEFTNIVSRPTKVKRIKAMSLTALPINNGVQIEARHIPWGVSALQFLVKNMTTFETDYRTVGSDFVLIDKTARSSDHALAIDKDVSPNNVYEYVARLVYEDGSVDLSTSETIEFIAPAPGKVDTKIDNVVVSNEIDPNVTFDIETTVIDSNIDTVKSLLQQQDMYELFKDDVAKEREFLKSLIAHGVQRVNLTTGAREDFGVLTTGSFSDFMLRNNQAIEPLKLGNRYRYEVVAMLRAPETMFESFVKEKTDEVTNKTYTFKPSKFLHPVTLSRGVLVTSQGLKTRYSKEPLAHGTIGAVTTIEVSFDSEQANVIDPQAARFNSKLNIVTWKLQGSMDSIDHFLIIKEVQGVRSVLGKAHSEFSYGNCQFLHTLSTRDAGSFSYVIVPVFNDYKVGSSVTTNTVLV